MGEMRRCEGGGYIDPWQCQRPPEHSPSYVVCVRCPRPWRDIPFSAFYMPHHVKVHLRDHPGHRMAWWCVPCQRLEDPMQLRPRQGEVIGRYPRSCDHCGGRLNFCRDSQTGPIYLQCQGCLCEWTAHWTLVHRGTVCPVGARRPA
jgi:hypothetical protein